MAILSSSVVFAQQSDSTLVRELVRADGLDIDGSLLKYRRSSLFSVVVKHPTFPYGNAIDSAFYSIPMPDKFNDHNLDVRSFESSATKMLKQGKKKDLTNQMDVDAFEASQHVARQMVAKWFNRSSQTGGFDMSLVQERGFYDASRADIEAAGRTTRNLAMLGDAGEDLIGKTFMIVNDITYVDKGQNSATAAAVVSGIGMLASAILGDKSIAQLGNSVAVAVNEIDGFTVNVTTYLYKLDWNDEISATFYQDYWYDRDSVNVARRVAFDESGLFTLSYVGSSHCSAQNTSSKSFSKLTKEQQMVRTCARAVDRAIVQLQRSYDEFKVNVPVLKVNENKTVEVAIGLKEGVNANSRYEVLMAKKDAEGHVKYQRIGLLAPLKDHIWDNRFGALDDARAAAGASAAEKAEKKKELAESNANDDDAQDGIGNAMLTSTRFKILEGAGRILPGSLVRECRIK